MNIVGNSTARAVTRTRSEMVMRTARAATRMRSEMVTMTSGDDSERVVWRSEKSESREGSGEDINSSLE